MPATGSESGLTLLEVLVALGIVAMAIGLGLPLLQRGFSPLQAMGVAREVTAALRETRAAAIAENNTVAFWVDTRAGSFGYGQRRFALPSQSGLTLSLYTTEDQRGRSAASSHTGTIHFFASGGSTGGGVTVSDGRRRLLVTVDWLSGQVKMTEQAAHGPSSHGAIHATR
jgi:general secretion pathway protein H